MDLLKILETFGLPVAMCIAFGYYIWKQNKFIQETLMQELEENEHRLEGIMIKLIDQQKKMQIEQKGIERSFEALVEIMAGLSGNGLKEKFSKAAKRRRALELYELEKEGFK
jgi:predicted ferric reductase